MSSQQSGSNSWGSNVSNLLSNSKNASNFGQNVFNAPQLQQLYQAAQGLFNNQNAAMPQAQQQAGSFINQTNQSALPAWQKQLQGGAYQGVDANDIYQQLQGSMNKPSETSGIYAQMMGGQGNNYADAMKAQYMKDANRAQDLMLANLDSRAAGAGMGGSSRQGIAQGLGMQGINDSLQKQLATTGYETFDKDLQNKLSIAGMADQNTLARQGMLQNMLGQKQAAIQGGIQGAGGMQNLGMGSFAPQMMPWQNLQQYMGAIGGPTILNQGSSSGSGLASGTSSGTSYGSSSGKSGGM